MKNQLRNLIIRFNNSDCNKAVSLNLHAEDKIESFKPKGKQIDLNDLKQSRDSSKNIH